MDAQMRNRSRPLSTPWQPGNDHHLARMFENSTKVNHVTTEPLIRLARAVSHEITRLEVELKVELGAHLDLEARTIVVRGAGLPCMGFSHHAGEPAEQVWLEA